VTTTGEPLPGRVKSGGRGAAFGPREALALIKSLKAPVAPVKTLIEESVAGRYSSAQGDALG